MSTVNREWVALVRVFVNQQQDDAYKVGEIKRGGIDMHPRFLIQYPMKNHCKNTAIRRHLQYHESGIF